MGAKSDKVVFYKRQNEGREAATGEVVWNYFWHRIASNGRIVGASTEGYSRLSDCRANYERQFIKPASVKGPNE